MWHYILSVKISDRGFEHFVLYEEIGRGLAPPSEGGALGVEGGGKPRLTYQQLRISISRVRPQAEAGRRGTGCLGVLMLLVWEVLRVADLKKVKTGRLKAGLEGEARRPVTETQRKQLYKIG